MTQDSRRPHSKKWGLTNWRTTLDYKPSTNWTYYGSIAHAEKGGNFVAPTVTLIAPLL